MPANLMLHRIAARWRFRLKLRPTVGRLAVSTSVRFHAVLPDT